MVNYSRTRLNRVFHALSDPTRRTIVQEVARGPKSLSELAQRFPISLSLATKHLGVLEEAGLVSSSKDGRVRTCRFQPEPMREAMGWIQKYEAYWEAGLDRMVEQMESEWEAELNDSNG